MIQLRSFQTLPGIYLLISNVLVILFGPSPYMLVQFGFFVAWAYLRFFKPSENGDLRGDRSETFAFQYWFPPPVRYVPSCTPFPYRLIGYSGLILRSLGITCTRLQSGWDWYKLGMSRWAIARSLDRDKRERKRSEEGKLISLCTSAI